MRQAQDLGRILFFLGAFGCMVLLAGWVFGKEPDKALLTTFGGWCVLGAGFASEGKRRNGRDRNGGDPNG